MKYIVVLADGMADEPIEQLNNKTPLEAANTPVFDELAKKGEVGLVSTIPKGMNPGSDTANLSVMGYDPVKYYTGRSPLEAISIGAEMLSDDVCFRVNFVHLTEDESEYDLRTLTDHSADEISTEEADELLQVIKDKYGDDIRHFFTGVSYRHALIWNGGSTDVQLTPPHNILGKTITNYLPKGDNAKFIYEMMKDSYDLLNNHPVNDIRREKGLRPANSIWPWGEGTKPTIPTFTKMFNKKGAMISAVDLLKGIAIAAEMNSIDVEGATGNIHTNYQGKVDAAIKTLEDGDEFVYIHVEAPDECGHRGEMENKVKAIEYIDQKVVKPLITYFRANNVDFRLTVLPDHPTPLRTRTHTSEPVPYFIYDSTQEKTCDYAFNENGAMDSGKMIKNGFEFMPYFLG